MRAPGPFAERDVDAKVLHRRVHELLDRLGQPVDFVDEQDRAFLGVGEVRQQVLRGGQGRAAGDLQRNAQIARDARGERRLAEAGRAIEQDVAQRLLALAGGVDGDRQPLGHLPLADHLVHVPRPQGDFVVAQLGERLARRRRRRGRFAQAVGGENRFAGHGAAQQGSAASGHYTRRQHRQRTPSEQRQRCAGSACELASPRIARRLRC